MASCSDPLAGFRPNFFGFAFDAGLWIELALLCVGLEFVAIVKLQKWEGICQRFLRFALTCSL